MKRTPKRRSRGTALLPAVPLKFEELLEGVLKVKPPAKTTTDNPRNSAKQEKGKRR
jgi:hypothetical protein